MEPINFGFQPNLQETKKTSITILEDSDIAQGRFAHIFVTGYNHSSEHYTLDFYQDSTPVPGANQINRRLVGRIFLTKRSLFELGKVLIELDQKVKQENATKLPEPKRE